MDPRRYEVDLAKAVGIVAVVLIHSMRPYFDVEVSSVEKWLGSATKFAVPAFLAASGVLYGTLERVRSEVTRARLRRLLVPYLFASVAAQLFWVAFDSRTLVASEVLRDFVFASSFSPFYYVLQALLFVLAVPVLAQLRTRTLMAVTFVAIVGQWASWVRCVSSRSSGRSGIRCIGSASSSPVGGSGVATRLCRSGSREIGRPLSC